MVNSAISAAMGFFRKTVIFYSLDHLYYSDSLVDRKDYMMYKNQFIPFGFGSGLPMNPKFRFSFCAAKAILYLVYVKIQVETANSNINMEER
jgi:hypothetical protein